MRHSSIVLYWLLMIFALNATAQTDLSQWNGKGSVPLIKGWQFIPSEFALQNFDTHKPIQEESGKSWNIIRIEDSTMSGLGKGTYFIKITFPKNIKQFELDIGTVSSAYALYVNKKLIKTVGSPYERNAEIQANYDTRITSVNIDSDTALIVLHVANYTYNKGGLWQSVYVSTDQHLTKKRRGIVGGLLILFGGLFIIGLYHLGIFLLRNTERAFLYFFLWTSLASMRLLFSGRYYPILDFINIEFDQIVRIEYFTFYAAIPLFLKFSYEVFPLYVNKTLIHIYLLIGLTFSLAVWIAPIYVLTSTLIYYQVFTTVGIIYTLRVLYKVLKHKETGAVLFGLGFLILSIVVIHDILVANNVLVTGYWFAMGLGLFVCFQSYLLASRFIKAFNKVEVLGRELNYLNVHLEKIVDKRTDKLKSANKKLQKQNKKVEKQSHLLKELNRELKKLSNVVSETDNAILIINPDGYIEWVNQGFTKLYGYNLKEMHKRFGENLRRAGQNKDIDEIFNTILETRESYNYESTIESKGGEKIFVQTTLTPIFSKKEELIYLVAIDSDIRKIKQIQHELDKANSAKNKLFSIIAHDLRSPFNSLLGLTNIIIERFDNLKPEKLLSLIKDLNETAQKTYHLLQNLLDWSQTQRNKIVISPDKHNLAEIISGTATLFETALAQKELTLKLQIEQQIEIYVDKPTTETIIRNLISNAIKFTHKKGNIDISAKTIDNFVSITVSDNGVGMDAQQIDLYLNTETENTTKGTENEIGTGLGFMLIKYFVEKNRGYIDIKSTIGKGTSVSISLPTSPTQTNN